MLGHTRPLVLALTIAALFFDSVWAHGPVHARLKEIDRRLAESPNDPALFVQRAALHREHRDLERARADLDRALGLNTDYPSARIARASLALALGEHDDAIRLSRAILATDLDEIRALGPEWKTWLEALPPDE